MSFNINTTPTTLSIKTQVYFSKRFMGLLDKVAKAAESVKPKPLPLPPTDHLPPHVPVL
jgi:hypothetical protein